MVVVDGDAYRRRAHSALQVPRGAGRERAQVRAKSAQVRHRPARGYSVGDVGGVHDIRPDRDYARVLGVCSSQRLGRDPPLLRSKDWPARQAASLQASYRWPSLLSFVPLSESMEFGARMPGSAAVIVDDRQFRPHVWRFIAARSHPVSTMAGARVRNP